LVGGIAGWTLSIASSLFVYSLVVAVGNFFLCIAVRLLAGILTLPRLESTGIGLVLPLLTEDAASGHRDRSTAHVVLSVTAAGAWSTPTAVNIVFVGGSLYGDVFTDAPGGLLAHLFFFADASVFSSLDGMVAVFTGVALGPAISGLGFFLCAVALLGVDRLLYPAGTTSPPVQFTRIVASTATGVGTYLFTGYVVWVSLVGCAIGLVLLAGAVVPAKLFA
jgi:hypothetical protein